MLLCLEKRGRGESRAVRRRKKETSATERGNKASTDYKNLDNRLLLITFVSIGHVYLGRRIIHTHNASVQNKCVDV